MANMRKDKNPMPSQEPLVRAHNFSEVALGYTKEMISNLRQMPFGTKSLEKRQADLISRLFPSSERTGVNATRLVTKAFQLHILDINNLLPDED